MTSSLHPSPEPRGVTLLVAIILTSVVLAVALSLFDISYKQVLLASTAKQSQYAFYAADSVMECALYWDQQYAAFNYNGTGYTLGTTPFVCNNKNIYITDPGNASTQNVGAGTRTTILSVPCAAGGTQGKITVYKTSSGSTSIYATGYSTCVATDPRRVERGLTVTYGDTPIP